jgi:hypothetical protein
MNITLQDLKEILCNEATARCASALTTAPYQVGKPYFIRTVTHHYTGILIAVHPGELVLSKCCWIPDDGRFADALKTGKFNEIEPFPADAEVIIGRGSIVDAVIFNAELPARQK